MLGLLEAVQDLEGDDGLERIFERRSEKQAVGYQARISSEDLEERVSELAVIRTEEGFMADWEKVSDDLFFLREHNCALYQIAGTCAQVCAFEQALFHQVLEGADVIRERHILSGDLTCTYAIRRRH
jgi:predicted ArsR family transcriptional regulator